jgi:hypothetical protein
MRILIIALPRTGSTSLMSRYSEEYRIPFIFEPFDPKRYRYGILPTDVVVKTMMYHCPNGFDTAIDAYIELVKEFDKVILLSRRDLKECSESWAYLQHHNHKNFNSLKHYVWKTPPNVEKYEVDIIRWDSELLVLSNTLNIPITYYEDIFDKNSNERYRKNISNNQIGLI